VQLELCPTPIVFANLLVTIWSGVRETNEHPLCPVHTGGKVLNRLVVGCWSEKSADASLGGVLVGFIFDWSMLQ
jgi:hypothetical protein